MAGCGGCCRCGGAGKAKRGTVCNAPDRWTVCVEVPDYAPNELCVKVCEGAVEVRGKKACGGECFTERYDFPCDVDCSTISWDYADCKLTITACKKKCC